LYAGEDAPEAARLPFETFPMSTGNIASTIGEQSAAFDINASYVPPLTSDMSDSNETEDEDENVVNITSKSCIIYVT